MDHWNGNQARDRDGLEGRVFADAPPVRRQFARHGVTAEQFVVLAALADGGVVTQRGLACRAIADPKTVRAMLLLIEKRGLIARISDRADG